MPDKEAKSPNSVPFSIWNTKTNVAQVDQIVNNLENVVSASKNQKEDLTNEES